MKRATIIQLLGWEIDRVAESDLLRRIEVVVEAAIRDERARCADVVMQRGQHAHSHEVRDFAKSTSKAIRSPSLLSTLGF